MTELTIDQLIDENLRLKKENEELTKERDKAQEMLVDLIIGALTGEKPKKEEENKQEMN